MYIHILIFIHYYPSLTLAGNLLQGFIATFIYFYIKGFVVTSNFQRFWARHFPEACWSRNEINNPRLYQSRLYK